MIRDNTGLDTFQITDLANEAVKNTTELDNLGQKLLAMWQQAHGAPEGVVTVTSSQNGVVVLIENAFSRAELVLAQQKNDMLLQKYIDGLTHQMLPMLTKQVETVTGKSIRSTSINFDIEQNWLMVFLKFA